MKAAASSDLCAVFVWRPLDSLERLPKLTANASKSCVTSNYGSDDNEKRRYFLPRQTYLLIQLRGCQSRSKYKEGSLLSACSTSKESHP